jgi:hypothetical protein
MSVIIGVDPHKGSQPRWPSAVTRRGSPRRRFERRAAKWISLLEWATEFDDRTWAVESAGGLGYLLAQQLVNRRGRRWASRDRAANLP